MREVKGIRREVQRRNGELKMHEVEVKHLGGNEYKCEIFDFTFDIETGVTSKGFKLGEWQGSARKVRFVAIIDEEAQEEAQEETKAETPTTLVEEWKYEDGTVKTHKEFANGQLWEKGSHKRLYLDIYGRGAYVDLKTNTFNPSRGKTYPVGEWIKEWGAKVECRYILR